jgi:hypothetical protein
VRISGVWSIERDFTTARCACTRAAENMGRPSVCFLDKSLGGGASVGLLGSRSSRLPIVLQHLGFHPSVIPLGRQLGGNFNEASVINSVAAYPPYGFSPLGKAFSVALLVENASKAFLINSVNAYLPYGSLCLPICRVPSGNSVVRLPPNALSALWVFAFWYIAR